MTEGRENDEKRRKMQEKKMEGQAVKKLLIDLERITTRVKKVQMSKKWEHDTDEKKQLSFVPDNESDGDVEIDINKCTKCDVTFKKNKKMFMDVTIAHDGSTRNACWQLFSPLPKPKESHCPRLTVMGNRNSNATVQNSSSLTNFSVFHHGGPMYDDIELLFIYYNY